MRPINVAKLRKRLKMSQGKLAKLLYVHRITVSRWENGHSKPSREHMEYLYSLYAEGRK